MKNMMAEGKINISMSEQGAYISTIQRKDGFVMVSELDWEILMDFIEDKIRNHNH